MYTNEWRFAEDMLTEKGYLNLAVDPTLNLVEEINRLKKAKNAVLLAHYYQTGDIQDVADFLGDSLGLAQKAAQTDADIILFAGVHFMAETAKILNPSKKVLLPDLNAGCSLADSAPTDLFRRFKNDHPEHIVISYINCTAEIKALSDIICTSSNAVQIVESLPKDQPIIFAPDKNLGAWINKITSRNMLLWNGSCMVHEIFSLEKITQLMHEHPDAEFIAHPECEAELLELASFIGSTTALLNHSKNSSKNKFIVGTETGIIHQMELASPHKQFIPAPPTTNCACNDCPHMKLNTLEKVYLALQYEQPELHMDESLRLSALKPIQRMLDLSVQFGL
ncbi:MAG: quinolinate synthase NadA [Bacteroidia bacterium]